MLKWHYSTVRSMKTGRSVYGAFVLFFRPHPGRIDSSRVVPTPENLPSKAKKKKANTQG